MLERTALGRALLLALEAIRDGGGLGRKVPTEEHDVSLPSHIRCWGWIELPGVLVGVATTRRTLPGVIERRGGPGDLRGDFLRVRGDGVVDGSINNVVHLIRLRGRWSRLRRFGSSNSHDGSAGKEIGKLHVLL